MKDERGAFEAEMQLPRHGLKPDQLVRLGDGYFLAVVDFMWKGWQAARAASTHPLATSSAEPRESDARDAEILRTLIHRTHACDLKFDKAGKVRDLHAIFKVDSVPGFGMTEGVRRYLDAFMEDGGLAAAPASNAAE